MLQRGESPVVEPGLKELVRKQVEAGRLRATCNVEEAVAETDLAMIAVGTPSTDTGEVSTAAVRKVVGSIGEALRNSRSPYTVVVRSTLLPGILEEQLATELEQASGRRLGPQLRLCNNPEFLRESTAIRDYDDPPSVLVGVQDEWDAEQVLQLYSKINARKYVVPSRTASLVKYACNAFHALKVTFANEIGALARSLSVDGTAVMELVCRDEKLNISPAYLRPGFAFGGSCLPKDVRAVNRHAQQQALDLKLLRSILPSNEAHLERGIRLIRQSGLRNIGMIGLSFKSDTDDLRESPLVAVAQTLIGQGYNLRIFDPNVRLSRLRGQNRAYIDEHLPHLAALLVDDPKELYEHASLLVLGSDVANAVPWQRDFEGEVVDLRFDLIRGEPSEPVQPEHGVSDSNYQPIPLETTG